MAPPRILLCGDVVGRLNQLFKRVASVNKSAGPFDALLCVGQFFPESSDLLEEFMDYIEGRSVIPLPTYFIGDYGAGAAKVLSAAANDPVNRGFKMGGLTICENLFWLRGSGKFTLHGLSVTYLSGRHSATRQQFGTYSEDDVDALRALAEDPGIVDIFLTNEWPSGVTNGASTDLPSGFSESPGSSSTVSELVAEIKPRYHIAGTKGIFYAREPYTNIEAVHVTRFFGLAAVGNKDKQKFMHAISPTPASTMSASEISMKPSNTSVSPYTLNQKRVPADTPTKRHTESDADPQYWRYDVTQKRQKHGEGDGNRLCFKFLSSGSCPRGDKCHFQHDEDAREQCRRGVCFDFLNKGKCERGPECSFKHSLLEEGSDISNRRPGSHANTDRSRECWFCLSSPSLESHLITGISEHYYCALAKGPLVEDHALIIPIEHSPTTLTSSPEAESELIKFQNSFKMYFKSQGKDVIFFEWVFKRSTHANLQVMPIPSSRANIIPNIFELAAQRLGFKFEEIKSDNSSDGRKLLKTKYDRSLSLFYVELPDGTIFYHIIEENEKFPAQFGREVLAGLLNKADKDNWRNCKLKKEEEEEMVENFKKRFENYDPTR